MVFAVVVVVVVVVVVLVVKSVSLGLMDVVGSDAFAGVVSFCGFSVVIDIVLTGLTVNSE